VPLKSFVTFNRPLHTNESLNIYPYVCHLRNEVHITHRMYSVISLQFREPIVNVRPTARHVLHLQYVSANALEIRAE
jgi:hypothetical protein